MDSMLMLNNTTLYPVLQLVFAIAGVIGFVMAGAGVYQIATSGQNRGHQSHGIGMGGTLLICGSLLTALTGTGSIVHLMMGSIYGGSASPEQVISSIPQTANQAQAWVAVVLNILVVLGWIAVVRGLMILGIAGSRREKGLGAGVTHLIAGMLLTNPAAFAQMVGWTIGQQDVVQILLPP